MCLPCWGQRGTVLVLVLYPLQYWYPKTKYLYQIQYVLGTHRKKQFLVCLSIMCTLLYCTQSISHHMYPIHMHCKKFVIPPFPLPPSPTLSPFFSFSILYLLHYLPTPSLPLPYPFPTPTTPMIPTTSLLSPPFFISLSFPFPLHSSLHSFPLLWFFYSPMLSSQFTFALPFLSTSLPFFFFSFLLDYLSIVSKFIIVYKTYLAWFLFEFKFSMLS